MKIKQIILMSLLLCGTHIFGDAWITGIFGERSFSIRSAQNWNNILISKNGTRTTNWGETMFIPANGIFCAEKFIIPWAHASQEIHITVDANLGYIIKDDDWKIRIYKLTPTASPVFPSFLMPGMETLQAYTQEELPWSPIALSRNNTCWYIKINIDGKLEMIEASDTNQCLREIGAGPCARNDVQSFFECAVSTISGTVSAGYKALTTIPATLQDTLAALHAVATNLPNLILYITREAPILKKSTATLQGSDGIIEKIHAGVTFTNTLLPLARDIEPIATPILNNIQRLNTFSIEFHDALKDAVPSFAHTADFGRLLQGSLQSISTSLTLINKLEPQIRTMSSKLTDILHKISQQDPAAFLTPGSLPGDILTLINETLQLAQNLAPRFAEQGDITLKVKEAFPDQAPQDSNVLDQMQHLAELLPIIQELTNRIDPLMQQLVAIVQRLTVFVEESAESLAQLINESIAVSGELTNNLAAVTPLQITPEKLQALAHGIRSTIEHIHSSMKTAHRLMNHIQKILPHMLESTQSIKKLTTLLK